MIMNLKFQGRYIRKIVQIWIKKDGAIGSIPCSQPLKKGSGAISGLAISRIQREMTLES